MKEDKECKDGVKKRTDELLSAFVQKKVAFLKETRDTPSTKALLAKLRRVAGQSPGSDLEVYGWILETIPEEFIQKDDVTAEEWAIWTALTISAFGNKTRVSGKAQPFAYVLAASAEGNEQQLIRFSKRLQRVAEAKDIRSLGFLLRQMFSLIQDSQIPIDYGQLAADLYYLQISNDRKRIQRNWGIDFSRGARKSRKESSTNKEDKK